MIGFVVNPISANGKGRKTWALLEKILIQRNAEYRAEYTAAPGDAVRIAAEMAGEEAIEAVVALGGDGTVHEAANGMFHAGSSKPLGYIPAGSGNDFARGFGIPLNAEEALMLVLGKHRLLQIDVLRFGRELAAPPSGSSGAAAAEGIAVNTAGIGFDGRAARVTNTASYKKWMNRIKLGKLAYVLSLIRVLATYKPCRITIEIDGAEHSFQDVWLVAAANIPMYGGGMKICPDADPLDGKMDICVVSGIGRLELLAVFPKVYNGSHLTHPAVHMLRGKRISVSSEHPLDIHADGEMAGVTPISLEVAPAALRIIAPE